MTGLVDLTQERMKYPHNSLPDVFDEVKLSAEVEPMMKYFSYNAGYIISLSNIKSSFS
jgi:hypothetical protein